MRILVTTIPFSGMKIDAPIPKDPLNVRLQEGSQGETLAFTDDPIADITLTRTHGGVLVKGVISGTCRQGCSTCGDPVAHEVLAPIDWILQTTSDRAGSDDDLDDPGVIVYEGEHLDLEEHLQEALILTLSPFWHPARDAQDRCSVCKRDCSGRSWRSGNVSGPAEKPPGGASFGDLLKGALGGTKRKG